ncbi:uncharacterized protein LOC119018676 isoform X2 [Acanthopagrus latus]|nr:uncharacterized protein LOC119018676 isoform X2 [Acanthopagrus latus]XP_036952627.1 uncharacterized protein LOC119018676 isoform X2 [Acanthopagrus latus]
MAKGKAKNNSSDSLAPPQPRSLRSRKREYPSEEISETDDVQAPLHHQDTERTNSAEDAKLLQCEQFPLQESTMTSAQQHQAAEQSCFIKQHPATEEENVEATNDKATEAKKETTVTNPNNDSEPLGFREQTDDDANRSGTDMEKITTEECNRSQSQTCTDQLQFLLPTSEEGDVSLAAVLEKHLGSKENSQIRQESSPEEQSSVYVNDVKEVTKEAPAKKKRRMGMCGLTEKERSHFLQTQKRENGQNGLDRAEKQICNNSADLVAHEDIKSAPHLPSPLSISGSSVTEQKEAEKTLQSSHCGEHDRAEKEVHTAVTTSDGTSAECESGCSKHKSCETERGPRAPCLEQPGDMKSDQPAEEEVWGSQEKQEQSAKSMAEKPQEQMKDGGDGSALLDQSPDVSFYCNPTQNDEREDQDAIEAAPPQVNSMTKTRDERKEELTCDAGDGDRAEAGAASTHSVSGGFNGGSVELCQAGVSPGGSERKDSCDPDDEPGAGLSTVSAEQPQTKDTMDLIGSLYLDYVSDSQLNTIALIEEEVMERDEDRVSPECHDATDLICGLIRELSSLNQKVMATHRELENLRRSSKTSRSSKL